MWLHNECGYSYIGDNSIYKLTIPEIRKLHIGYEIKSDKEDERMSEQNPQYKQQRPRKSDKKALSQFKQQNNL